MRWKTTRKLILLHHRAGLIVSGACYASQHHVRATIKHHTVGCAYEVYQLGTKVCLNLRGCPPTVPWYCFEDVCVGRGHCWLDWGDFLWQVWSYWGVTHHETHWLINEDVGGSQRHADMFSVYSLHVAQVLTRLVRLCVCVCITQTFMREILCLPQVSKQIVWEKQAMIKLSGGSVKTPKWKLCETLESWKQVAELVIL